jgi:hypothetical protein
MTCVQYYEKALLPNRTLVPLAEAAALDHAVRRAGHETRAAEKWGQFYDQDIADVVFELYKVDFDLFGYERKVFEQGDEPRGLA